MVKIFEGIRCSALIEKLTSEMRRDTGWKLAEGDEAYS